MTQEPLPAALTGMPAPLTVAGALSENRINLNLTGADADSVLRELVAMVVPPMEKVLSQKLFKALKAREKLCSTCVNEGIAIPHARNAIVGIVAQPALVYGRHRTGVEFGALDEKPVRHFFLLCAPNVRDHLHLLARLTRLLQKTNLRDQLAAAETPADALAVVTRLEHGIP